LAKLSPERKKLCVVWTYINSYDLLLGLDFLIKIGVVIDVEKGVIKVHNGPGMEVDVLPLNVMNML
jgi:hypothetical protein